MLQLERPFVVLFEEVDLDVDSESAPPTSLQLKRSFLSLHHLRTESRMQVVAHLPDELVQIYFLLFGFDEHRPLILVSHCFLNLSQSCQIPVLVPKDKFNFELICLQLFLLLKLLESCFVLLRIELFDLGLEFLVDLELLVYFVSTERTLESVHVLLHLESTLNAEGVRALERARLSHQQSAHWTLELHCCRFLFHWNLFKL